MSELRFEKTIVLFGWLFVVSSAAAATRTNLQARLVDEEYAKYSLDFRERFAGIGPTDRSHRDLPKGVENSPRFAKLISATNEPPAWVQIDISSDSIKGNGNSNEPVRVDEIEDKLGSDNNGSQTFRHRIVRKQHRQGHRQRLPPIKFLSKRQSIPIPVDERDDDDDDGDGGGGSDQFYTYALATVQSWKAAEIVDNGINNSAMNKNDGAGDIAIIDNPSSTTSRAAMEPLIAHWADYNNGPNNGSSADRSFAQVSAVADDNQGKDFTYERVDFLQRGTGADEQGASNENQSTSTKVAAGAEDYKRAEDNSIATSGLANSTNDDNGHQSRHQRHQQPPLANLVPATEINQTSYVDDSSSSSDSSSPGAPTSTPARLADSSGNSGARGTLVGTQYQPFCIGHRVSYNSFSWACEGINLRTVPSALDPKPMSL